MINEAIELCKLAHKTQVRKYTNEPYWLHCREVAFLVEAVGGTEEMICAAWLHDTVEDTPITLADIEVEFGEKVASLVEMLTDVSKPEDGNREVRKAIDRAHSMKASPEGKAVKLADLISNSTSIARYDKDFAVVYMREKELLLPHLYWSNDVCDHATLFTMAERILKRYRENHGTRI